MKGQSWALWTFKQWMRPLRSAQMLEFNPFLTFVLGGVIQETKYLRIGTRISQWAENIIRWKSLLRTIVTSQYVILPETRECIEAVLEVLLTLIPDQNQGQEFRDRLLTEGDLQGILDAEQRLVHTFERESLRVIVVGLQRQRAFDTHTLIDSIETAFSKTTWSRLSQISRREMEEAGFCLAFERYTASGFHALRGIEYEIRDYVQLATRKPIRESDRNWGAYIRTLTSNDASSKLLTLLNDIKNLDRNPLIHPEHWLDIDQAVQIFCSAQTALDRLTTDMFIKNLLPRDPVTAPSA